MGAVPNNPLALIPPQSGNQVLASPADGSSGLLVPRALVLADVPGGGTVTSVAVTVPAEFSVGGSPITSAGTIAIGYAAGLAANRVLATPDGSTGPMSLRSLVVGDIPALTLAKISDAGTAAGLNTGTSAGNVPVLDSGGKLDTSILPSLAIGETFVVASQAAMLALTAQDGDIAVRSDQNKTYRLTTSPASTLGNWQELLVSGESPVQSVAGKTGAVTLVSSDVGLGNVINAAQLVKANDLSDLNNAATARTNLGVYSVGEVDSALTAKANISGQVFTGAISAINLSGTNTGDQTITLMSDVTGSGTGSFATTLAAIQGTTVSGTSGTGKVIFSSNPVFDLGPITLTSTSTTTGILMYSTVDHVTNYSRLNLNLAGGAGMLRVEDNGTITGATLIISVLTYSGANFTHTIMRRTQTPFFEDDVGITSTSGAIRQQLSNRTATSGETQELYLSPTYNQASGTASNKTLKIDRIEQSLGSGPQEFAHFRGGTLGTTDKFIVDNTGAITLGIWLGTKTGLDYGGTNADLSATGGTSQYLKQSSSGAAVTVGTIAAGDLPALNALTAPTGDVSLNSHKITNLTDPASAQDSATKAYVDAATQGLDPKPSCRVATTANITLSGTQTIDSKAVVVGDRVLVKDQTTASDNGIRVVAVGAWPRASDADTSAEVTSGMFVFVSEGTVNASTGWILTTADPITLDTTSLSFSQFSGAGTYTATGGVTLTGTQFSLTANGTTYAKLQQVAASSLVGNATGSLANATGITIGATLAFSGAALQTAAMTGDVTAAANSFVTTVAKIQNTTVSGTTGTGSVVFATAPTIAGGAHTALTGLGIRSTGAAFDLTLASSEVLTAGRTLSFVVGNASRTVTLGGNFTTSGAFNTTLTVTADTNVTLTSGTMLATTGSGANLTAVVKTVSIKCHITGSGSVITAGGSDITECLLTGTLTGYDVIADQSGSVSVDVQRCSYANYGGSGFVSLVGSGTPVTLSSAIKNQDNTLTSWTTSLTSGDKLKFVVSSASTVNDVWIFLHVTAS